MQELFSFVSHLADLSGDIIRQYYRTDFAIEAKADESPVTIADRAVEAALRQIIEKERPEDGILGEEYGIKDSQNGFTWVLDPIDGTKSFTIGRPSFGTLIAYCHDGCPVLGVIDQPVLKERWVGDGKNTTFNGHPVKTRRCDTMKAARIASTAPAQLPDLWHKLDRECAYTIWGGDCYSYGLLANGWLDGILESGLAPYDYAALVPIVTGAGGWIGDWDGLPLTLTSNGKTIAVGDVRLKDRLLEILKA